MTPRAERLKRCSCPCHQLLPVTDFALDYSRWDRRQRVSKRCAARIERERRKKALDSLA